MLQQTLHRFELIQDKFQMLVDCRGEIFRRLVEFMQTIDKDKTHRIRT